MPFCGEEIQATAKENAGTAENGWKTQFPIQKNQATTEVSFQRDSNNHKNRK